jgi:hypothetical protein
MPSKKITPLFSDTYLAVIKNSVGSKCFRNSYAKIGGKKTDILKNGSLSCAFFASSILRMFDLIKDLHATVGGTIKDLRKSGWREIKTPKIGSILVWEAKKGNDGVHKHIGFYIDKDRAISNDAKSRTPEIHHWTYGIKNGRPARKIETIFWNNKVKQ